MKDYQIRTNDKGIKPLIERMARDSRRTVGNELALIVRAEYERRHPAEKGQKKECEEAK